MEPEPPREHSSFCLICSLSSSLWPVGWGLFAWHWSDLLSADWDKEGRENSSVTRSWTFLLHLLRGDGWRKPALTRGHPNLVFLAPVWWSELFLCERPIPSDATRSSASPALCKDDLAVVLKVDLDRSHYPHNKTPLSRSSWSPLVKCFGCCLQSQSMRKQITTSNLARGLRRGVEPQLQFSRGRNCSGIPKKKRLRNYVSNKTASGW